MFYPVKVLAPEIGRMKSARLRGTARLSARRQTLTHFEQVRAGTVLVQITSQRTYRIDEGIALGGPDEFRRQLTELLTQGEADRELGSLRRAEGPQQTTYEILSPVGSPSSEATQMLAPPGSLLMESRRSSPGFLISSR